MQELSYKEDKMGVTVKQFGKTIFGKEMKLYTIENAKGAKAAVTNVGACLVELVIPDAKGSLEDIVLGFDCGEAYLVNGSFFGATVGRSANRIADAKFEIDGTVYNLDVNDNANNLHSQFDMDFINSFGMLKRLRMRLNCHTLSLMV